MGLALLDVADVIRPHAQVVAFLERLETERAAAPASVSHVADEAVVDRNFLEEMQKLPGGREAVGAIQVWLDKYGMRGAGEIDITRPRWSERPTMLVNLLLGNIKNCLPGAASQRFENGLRNARAQELDLLQRLRTLPDGEQKAAETSATIDRLRTFIGYREFPKYGMVCRVFVYKQALLRDAERLVRAGVLNEREDIFWLRFQELQEVVRTNRVDQQLISERKDAFESYRVLRPPRVLTSDGVQCGDSRRRCRRMPATSRLTIAASPAPRPTLNSQLSTLNSSVA